MEVVSDPSDMSASQELSSKSESVMTPNIPHQYGSGDLSLYDLKLCLDEFLNDLKMCLDEFISIEDSGISTNCLPAGNNKKCDVVLEDESHLDESNNNLPDSTSSVEELLAGEQGSEDNRTPEAKGCDVSVCQSNSLPESSAIPIKPTASAMKGSREKQGIPPKKLSVTWAPDVFDPIPTSVSHVPSTKNQQYRNNGRKYGKNKQRGGGKSSRGNKGKDKKQARKMAGAHHQTEARM